MIGQNELEAEVIYNGPIQAPISKGQQIAELVIKPMDLPEIPVPLVAEADVAQGGFSVRMRTATTVLMSQFGLTAEGAS